MLWRNQVQQCTSEGVERLNWQSEYCFRSKASVTAPTDASFQLNCNVKRAYGDTHITLAHPLLDPLELEWMRGTMNTILKPVMLPTSMSPAPDYISSIYQVFLWELWISSKLLCVLSALQCTVFCRCDGVMNVLTVVMLRTVQVQ